LWGEEQSRTEPRLFAERWNDGRIPKAKNRRPGRRKKGVLKHSPRNPERKGRLAGKKTCLHLHPARAGGDSQEARRNPSVRLPTGGAPLRACLAIPKKKYCSKEKNRKGGESTYSTSMKGKLRCPYEGRKGLFF